MNNKNEIDEIAGIKFRLSKLQVHSNKFKNSLFDYIEGLESTYNVFSKHSRDDSSFEIYGNKLKIKATYNSQDTSFQGLFSANVLEVDNEKDKYIDLLSWKFDTSGNIKNAEGIHFFTADDFAESFYIELMNKLIESDNFEL